MDPNFGHLMFLVLGVWPAINMDNYSIKPHLYVFKYKLYSYKVNWVGLEYPWNKNPFVVNCIVFDPLLDVSNAVLNHYSKGVTDYRQSPRKKKVTYYWPLTKQIKPLNIMEKATSGPTSTQPKSPIHSTLEDPPTTITFLNPNYSRLVSYTFFF